MKSNMIIFWNQVQPELWSPKCPVAGVTTAVNYSDMMITIDADLQDDINAIPKMVQKYHEGKDIVYGVRNNRDTDTAFKRKTALAFYDLMKKLGVNMVPNFCRLSFNE